VEIELDPSLSNSRKALSAKNAFILIKIVNIHKVIDLLTHVFAWDHFLEIFQREFLAPFFLVAGEYLFGYINLLRTQSVPQPEEKAETVMFSTW